MRIEVLLIIDVKEIPADPLTALRRALERRGWLSTSENMFRIALKTQASDTEVVNYVERDVREAEYVAGLQDVQSVCLLNSREHDQNALTCEWDPLQETGSDVNLI
jgi:hypothetical protein